MQQATWACLSLLVLGCSPPFRGYRGTTAQVATVLHYSAAAWNQCRESGDRTFLPPRPRQSDAGAIDESSIVMDADVWQVEACGLQVQLNLRCDETSGFERCRSDPWPTPPIVESRVIPVFSAALASAPRCPDDEWEAIQLRLLDGDRRWHGNRFELRRCGQTRVVEVRCPASSAGECTSHVLP
ncbi:MAG: hypothetical protein AAGE52_20250 [Myxococcota bacterium]